MFPSGFSSAQDNFSGPNAKGQSPNATRSPQQPCHTSPFGSDQSIARKPLSFNRQTQLYQFDPQYTFNSNASTIMMGQTQVAHPAQAADQRLSAVAFPANNHPSNSHHQQDFVEQEVLPTMAQPRNINHPSISQQPNANWANIPSAWPHQSSPHEDYRVSTMEQDPNSYTITSEPVSHNQHGRIDPRAFPVPPQPAASSSYGANAATPPVAMMQPPAKVHNNAIPPSLSPAPNAWDSMLARIICKLFARYDGSEKREFQPMKDGSSTLACPFTKMRDPISLDHKCREQFSTIAQLGKHLSTAHFSPKGGAQQAPLAQGHRLQSHLLSRDQCLEINDKIESNKSKKSEGKKRLTNEELLTCIYNVIFPGEICPDFYISENVRLWVHHFLRFLSDDCGKKFANVVEHIYNKADDQPRAYRKGLDELVQQVYRIWLLNALYFYGPDEVKIFSSLQHQEHLGGVTISNHLPIIWPTNPGAGLPQPSLACVEPGSSPRSPMPSPDSNGDPSIPLMVHNTGRLQHRDPCFMSQ